MKPHNLMHLFSYIFCLGSLFFLFYNYNNLPDSVPIHRNIKGEVDSWGYKSTLVLLPIINLLLLFVLSFFIKKPEMANYPVKISEDNKALIHSKMKILLSVASLVISIIFIFLLLDSMMFIKINTTIYISFFIIVMILPLFVYKCFKTQKVQSDLP